MKRRHESSAAHKDIAKSSNETTNIVAGEAQLANESIHEITENIENEPGPSTKKIRKRTSPIWNHFSVKVSEVDNKSKYSHCNYCEKKYVFAGSSNGGTGNLKNHLKSAHPERMPVPDTEIAEVKFEFSQEGFRKTLVKWIIMSDQPFCECSNAYFLEMIASLNPDAENISAATVKRDIMEYFATKINEIKLKLKKAPGKFSFTLDAWTSKNALPFMAIRTHWLDAEWVYQTVLLDFCYIVGKHDGENFCKIFLECLQRFEISLSKVLSLTMDNVSSNDTFMEFLTKNGIKVGIHISTADNRVRCMPHILNLSVQDILASLKVPLNYDVDKYEHLDGLELNGASENTDEEAEDEDEDDAQEASDGVDAESKPTIPKLRKLIKKIRKSPQKRQKLKRLCDLYDIPYLAPVIDVSTRWNSTYNMIERAAYLKVPLRALCSNEKSLNDLCMSEFEWKELNSLSNLLQKFDRSTKLLSMERHPSICAYIPSLNWLIESVESFIAESSGPLADAAQIGLDKLKKYEQETLIKKSNIPYIAQFLNPALKMSYFKEHNYTKAMVKEIQKSICEEYEKNYERNNTNTDEKADEELQDEFDEFFDHMFKRAKTSKEPKEFQKYLNFPLSSAKTDVIEYWRSQKGDFPNLSAMARDYLAVQSSSVAVERDFSTGVDLVTPTRCCLAPETIRACMCLKSWIKNQQCDSRL